ncbi:M14 family metallopeptidase [Klebsiella pneumoniae]|nr:M14 family metallopeptidase [Klebsiella pneumoniae]
MNINNKIQWEDNIKLLTRLERVEGGRSGAANIQAEQLANRTLWLKAQLESVRDGRELTFYKDESDPDGTIKGMKGTDEWEIFRVAQGVSETDSFIYYLHLQGDAVQVAAMPGSAAIADIINVIQGILSSAFVASECEFHNDNNEGVYAIVDDNGGVSFSVDMYGSTSSDNSYEFHNNDLGAIFSYIDENGYISLFMDSSGDFPTGQKENFEFHNDDNELLFVFSGYDGIIILGFDGAGNLVNSIDKREIEALQDDIDRLGGDMLSIKGGVKAVENEVSALKTHSSATDTRVADLAAAGLSGYNLYVDVPAGIAAGDTYFGVPEASVVALYRNNGGAAELVFRGPDLLNLAERTELISDGQIYRDGDRVTVRRRFNSLYTTAAATILPDYAALIGLYDGLMAEFPDSVTKIEIGESSVPGEKIYGYTITPPSLLRNSESYPYINPPRIIINGSIHGHEKAVTLSTFVFAQELCQRWQNDDVLEMLRHGVEFVFLPSINPHGVNNSVRKNANGVDLNRNFPFGWATGGVTDPNSENYRGPHAASEPETQSYIEFLNNHDSIATIESHNGAWYPGEDTKQIGWIGTEGNNNALIGSLVARRWNSFAQREFDLTMSGNNSTSRLSKVSDGGNSKYQLNTLGRSSFLFEMPFSINGSTWQTIYYSVNAYGMLCEEIYKNWMIKQVNS